MTTVDCGVWNAPLEVPQRQRGEGRPHAPKEALSIQTRDDRQRTAPRPRPRDPRGPDPTGGGYPVVGVYSAAFSSLEALASCADALAAAALSVAALFFSAAPRSFARFASAAAVASSAAAWLG